MSTRIFLFFSISFFFHNSLFSQKKWSLEDCIEYAIINNIIVKQDSLKILISDQNLIQSKAAVLPNLNSSATHNYNFGQVLDPYTNQFATNRVLSNNLGLGSSITLFNGFKLVNTIKRDKYLLESNKLNFENSKFEMKINLSALYLQILLNIEQITIINHKLENINLQLANQQNLLKNGSITKQPILELNVQKNSTEMELLEVKKQKEENFSKLKQKLNLSYLDTIELQLPIKNIETSELQIKTLEYYESLAQNNYKYKSLELNYKSAEYNLLATKSNLLPKLSFNSSIASGYSGLKKEATGSPNIKDYQVIGFTQNSNEYVLTPTYETPSRVVNWGKQINQNLNYSLGFSLSVPIFNGLTQKFNISRIKIENLIKHNELEETKKSIINAYVQIENEINSIIAKLKLSYENLDTQKELFKITENKFSNGIIPFFEYQLEMQKLTNFELELKSLEFELILKRTILIYYSNEVN